MNDLPMRRRNILAAAGGLALSPWAAAASHIASPVKATYTIAQVVDTSIAQQDVSKDIMIGSKAAWQYINSLGGIQGHQINHATFKVDGTPQSVQSALQAIYDDSSCIAISAAAGERAALELVNQIRERKVVMANIAPWLQNSALEVDDRTFPIFAGRQEQLSHALHNLVEHGVRDVGAIYATEQDMRQYREDIDRLATNLKLKLKTFEPNGDVATLGRQLTPDTPVILLFVGGTPEIMAFMQGAGNLKQRYIVALADVNLQTLIEIGSQRTTSVIGTQVVPVMSSSLPVVRQYKTTLAKYFDEPPSALSLAGFIAARYTFEVLNSMDGSMTRANVLATFQKRSVVDVGGFRVSYGNSRRSGNFVAQSMLTADGRLIS
jgi:ABC-type branched-subunit amino acid transport system substrate-binding protein